MSIYVSSGAFVSTQLPEVIEQAERAGVTHLELSSGLAPMAALEDFVPMLKASTLTFAVHNYFPAPETPFVLNLGSPDSNSLARSREHVRQALNLAAQLGCKYYSVHSPFALALTPGVLGKPSAQAALAAETKPSSYERVYELFIESLKLLLPHADESGLTLLIENNVVASRYFGRMEAANANPFLMCRAEELEALFAEAPRQNLALLLDVGHLNVSATALGFDRADALERLLPFTRVFHLSDNDGLEDQNLPVTNKAWFWPYLKDIQDRDVVIEAYRLSEGEIRSQVSLMRQQLAM